jgi:hypothetical protein
MFRHFVIRHSFEFRHSGFVILDPVVSMVVDSVLRTEQSRVPIEESIAKEHPA